MKYRMVRRSKGWVIQRSKIAADYHPAQSAYPEAVVPGWTEITCWRFRLLAALHLLWLRERARK